MVEYQIFLFFWNDKKIYCSELVWKIYERRAGIKLCSLKQFKDFDFSARRFAEEVRNRYGNKVPQNEKAVSPEQIYNSGLLMTVKYK